MLGTALVREMTCVKHDAGLAESHGVAIYYYITPCHDRIPAMPLLRDPDVITVQLC